MTEGLDGRKVLVERPWSVEYKFTLGEGEAEDSEGLGPDGWALVVTSSGGVELRVVVDTYWNPTSGDRSGNCLRIEVDGAEVEDGQAYVPTPMDDGKEHHLLLSNLPGGRVMAVGHCRRGEPVVIYHVFDCPFPEEEDLSFEVEEVGNGRAEVDRVGFVSL